MSAETVQGDASYPAEPTWRLPVSLRRVLVLAPPLLLAGLEVAHPQPQMNVQALMDASTWFATFHVIQLVLAGLIAVSVLLLADSFGRAWLRGRTHTPTPARAGARARTNPGAAATSAPRARSVDRGACRPVHDQRLTRVFSFSRSSFDLERITP
jgi:hypothetical protein